jgi:hypothetical protein
MFGSKPNVLSMVGAGRYLSPIAARTATFNSAGFDTKDFLGRALIIQHMGAVSGTTPTLNGKIQDSDDNSTFADVSGATFTEVTATDQNRELSLNLDGVRRYIRYTGTIAGTTPSFTMGVLMLAVPQILPNNPSA